jgi:hypothetical protein
MFPRHERSVRLAVHRQRTRHGDPDITPRRSTLFNVAASSDQLHGELRRLEHGWRDVESAAALLHLLEAQSSYSGDQLGPTVEGLWTGVAVSYMRPFRGGLRVDESWEQFDDPVFKAMHDNLGVLRDKLFAHTDPQNSREVLLLPYGPKGLAEGRGFATEGRNTFKVAAIEPHRRLFEFQRDRMRARRDELAVELSSRGEWKLGSPDW